MKKTIYFLLAFLFVFTSCVQELNQIDRFPKAEDKGKVAVTMKLIIPSVELSADTKANARSINPQIDYIRVAVFGTSGYLQDYAYAEPVDAEGNPGSYATTNYETNNDVYYFKVLLPIYEGEAHVHVIANGPESIPYVGPDGDQTEDVLMSKMETTGNVGGFWARVVLPDGILPQYSSDGIMMTDPAGNFIPSEETADKFEDLTLIRNFAQISLQVLATQISDVTWTLVNDPVSGSMAPMKDGEFVDTYKHYDYVAETRKMVRAAGTYEGVFLPEDTYEGYMASGSLNETVPAGTAITTPDTTPLFCYERVDPNKTKPTFILMKAKFNADNKYYYYRVDLNDEVLGGYFPLYRNFNYQIKINNVVNKGADTPEEAALRNSGGNMSISAETKTLTDVSDGISRLYVEYVEKTFTNTNQTTKTFWVYYVPDITDVDEDNNAIINNDGIEVTVKEMGDHPALANATITKDASDPSLNIYTFTLNGQSSAYDQTSVLQVKANNGLADPNHSILYRDITLRVMKKMDMSLTLYPKRLDEGAHTDQDSRLTVLHIALSDTLQESMFPLEFQIEDTNRSLNPTGKDGHNNTITVPVKIGASIHDDTNDESYYFIRSVQWSEYEPMRDAWIAAKAAGQSTEGIIDFTTQFKTIKPVSATTVYVDCEYFNMDSVNLLNGSGAAVTPTNTTVAYNTTSLTVQVETGEDTDTWTVQPGQGVTVNTTGGTGSGSFTMTFDKNYNPDLNATRTATVTSGGKSQDVTVNQEAPVFTLSASSAGAAHVGPDANTLNFDLTTTLEEEWEVTVDNDATLTRTRAGNTSSVTGTGNASFSVNIQPNGISGDNPKVYTVTASCHGITRTFTIEQEALVFSLNASEGSETTDGWEITRKASQTIASFTVTSNSADTWDISGSDNVTTATKDGSTVNIEFPNNMEGTATVERSVTVSIEFGGNTISRTFHITQAEKQLVERNVTTAFSIENQTTLSLTDDDHDEATVELTRSNFSYNSGYFYNTGSTPRTMTFKPAAGITITSISLTWSSNNGNYFNPSAIATQTGYSNFTVNTTDATWSGSCSDSNNGLVATFTCRGTNTNANNRQRRTQVNGITVSYKYEIYE